MLEFTSATQSVPVIFLELFLPSLLSLVIIKPNSKEGADQCITKEMLQLKESDKLRRDWPQADHPLLVGAVDD